MHMRGPLFFFRLQDVQNEDSVVIAADAAFDPSIAIPNAPRSEGFVTASRLLGIPPATLQAALTVRTVGNAGVQSGYVLETAVPVASSPCELTPPPSSCVGIVRRECSSVFSVPLSMDQAVENRDSLVKTLYSVLFQWLVDRMNAILDTRDVRGIPPPPPLKGARYD